MTREDAYILIAQERARAAERQGYTGEYDDSRHKRGDLLWAASCYFLLAKNPKSLKVPGYGFQWKPRPVAHDNLIKAGALALAAYEQCERRDYPITATFNLLEEILRAIVKGEGI